MGRRIAAVVASTMAALAAAVIAGPSVDACTAFCAADKTGAVLVGNNEDWNNPRTKIRFIPAAAGSYGRLYVGFDDLWPQGGLNERGLWFDGFATPPVRPLLDLPSFPGNIIEEAMARCATVEEVVQLFGRHNRAFLSEAILMFADASGDAVSIEANAIVHKRGPHFVQTNFHQSRAQSTPDWRFTTATTMLQQSRDDVSVDLFRRILAATHQEGSSPTLYSNVYDLRARKMYLYYFHDYDHVVTIDLARELEKGERIVDIPSLFPRNAAAETFAAARLPSDEVSAPVAISAVLAALAVLLAIAIYALLRATRRVRLGALAAAGLTIAAIAGLVAIASRPRAPDDRWLRFSIGPASGENAWISGGMIRSNGIALLGAIATAYDIPAVRIVAPTWVATTRYAINAVVDLDDTSAFKSNLKDELIERLHLVTHVEQRPFDILVLRAGTDPQLERAPRIPRIQVNKESVRLEGASLEDLARALQSLLGRPVVDETGITGTYNLQLEAGPDRVASIASGLRDRFGLTLTPERRQMEALIVDEISRDASLVLLAHAGRAMRWAPPSLRDRLSHILSIR